MTPAPDDVYECPSCKKLIRGRNLASGNMLGAIQYSDMYWFRPFMPSYPDFTSCKGCGVIFKLSSLKSIGTHTRPRFRRGLTFHSLKRDENGYETPPSMGFTHITPPVHPHYEEWEAADVAEPLTLYDLAQSIELGVVENEEDFFTLRRLLWFSFNDRVRNGEALFQSEGDEHAWRENLEALLVMLKGEDDISKIMSAEINRNLGNFDKSILILKSIENSKSPWIIDVILNECKKGNRLVVPLKKQGTFSSLNNQKTSEKASNCTDSAT